MKKIFLPLGLFALIVAPSAGSAKLVLDIPPILAGTGASNSCLEYAGCPSGPCYPGCLNPCVKCDLKCVDYSECLAGPCYPECAATDPCQPCCAADCDPCSLSCENPCTSCVAFNDTGTTASVATGDDAQNGRDADDKTKSNDDGRAGFSFTKLAGDGTELTADALSWACVKDNVTGLIWEDKANWGDRTTKANAVAPAVTCGSSLTWHLPTVKELMSIVSYHTATGSVGNSTNTFFLLPAPLGAGDGVFFWTETTSRYSTGYYWGIAFQGGRLDYLVSLAYPRFVKGTLAPNLADGTDVVIDKNFKLVWKKCLEGYSGATCGTAAAPTTFTWQQSLDRAAAAGSGWRLPNIKELQSIVDETRSQPAINTNFPGTPNPSNVWSSSPTAGVSGNSWYAGFHGIAANGVGYGETLYAPNTTTMHVRLVRDCTGAECD